MLKLVKSMIKQPNVKNYEMITARTIVYLNKSQHNIGINLFSNKIYENIQTDG